MPADGRQREYHWDMMAASALIAVGLVVSVLALTRIAAGDSVQVAQATPPTQSTPGAESKPSGPPPEPLSRERYPPDALLGVIYSMWCCRL